MLCANASACPAPGGSVPRDARNAAGRHRPRYFLRIAPRRWDAGPEPEDARSVPRGEEPARGGRPVAATLAILALVLGLCVQADRWQDCRAEGGNAVACLVAH